MPEDINDLVIKFVHKYTKLPLIFLFYTDSKCIRNQHFVGFI
ncbi:hypothetical protein IFVP182_C260081 [Vibrio parahaemolyticus]